MGALMVTKRKKRGKKEFDIKDYKKNESGKYILPLNDPIVFGKETIKEFTMETPKAKHLRDMPGDPSMGDIYNIIADLAGQPDSIIDELSMRDSEMAIDYFNSFD